MEENVLKLMTQYILIMMTKIIFKMLIVRDYIRLFLNISPVCSTNYDCAINNKTT